MFDFSDIKNFRHPDPNLYTCGQPSEADLENFALAGVQTVINLALQDDPDYSLADEAGTVHELDMDYIHIPVHFDQPTGEDLQQFFDAMQENQGKILLVHCAANMRVTAFLGLFWHISDGLERKEAFQLMDSVWRPDTTWAKFIEDMITSFL